MKKIFTLSLIYSAIPLLAFGATSMKLSDLLIKVAKYFNLALYLLMGFAVLSFVYNIVVKFIATSSVKKAEASLYVMWSVIGFFAIFSIWGLVNILIATFDLGTGSPQAWSDLNNLFPR
jgi:predicted membrane channel-forming protein YqfA (hemolysin III family)